MSNTGYVIYVIYFIGSEVACLRLGYLLQLATVRILFRQRPAGLIHRSLSIDVLSMSRCCSRGFKRISVIF